MSGEEKAVAQNRESRGVWWLNPAVAFGVPTLAAGLTAFHTDTKDYLYFWRTAKYFDLSCVGLLIGVVIVFACGCLLGAARRARSRRPFPPADWTQRVSWKSVRLLFQLSFALTVLAYGIWFGLAVKNGLNLGVVLGILHATGNAVYDLRLEYLITIPGVTTGTQFGLAVIALGVPLGAVEGWRTVRWQCAIVFGLAFVRAFLNSERLALIELIVPFTVSFVRLRPARNRWLRLLTQFAPIVAAMLLYLFFAGGEYFRSWAGFYAQRESNFWSFIGLRLTGYYVTALNNGALLWRSKPLALNLAPATLDFMWRFPGVKELVPALFPSFTSVSGVFPDQRYMDLLATSSNVEFNNPSGIFAPIVEYGVAAGLLYWLLCGLICGYLYKEFERHKVAGIFLYPALYISLVEATRVLYWATGRFLPGMFLLVVGVLFLFGNSAGAYLQPSFHIREAKPKVGQAISNPGAV